MASESLTNTNISETYVGVLHAKGEALPASGQEDIYDGNRKNNQTVWSGDVEKQLDHRKT